MEEKLETYYFTFGVGQKYEGKFVKITAESYMDARAKMVDRFGTKWAFQYSEDEWVNGKDFHLVLYDSLADGRALFQCFYRFATGMTAGIIDE